MTFPLRCSLVLLLPLLASRAMADHPLGPADKLGTVRFDVAGDAETQARVTYGVKLLHHMMYVEADAEFAAVIAHDPDCGFGYWGRAMTIVHPVWPDIPDKAELARGLAIVRTGAARSLHTERERAYLSTMAAFFAEDAGSLPARLKATDAAWARVVTAYPRDLDAAAFSALYHLAPARFAAKDKSHRLQFESVALLEPILAQIPDHPGALHYKIHALDLPVLAGRALEVCASYGEIAPEVPHALHMPTHIFTREGQWDKSIDYNTRSAAASRDLVRKNGAMNSHLPHALDYLAYAYLQRGQFQRAEEIVRQLCALAGPYQSIGRPAMAFALAAAPARLALERKDWRTASEMPLRQPASFPWGDSFLYCDSITRFARALGSVRSSDRPGAQRELQELRAIGQRINQLVPGSYWASQSQVQQLTIEAWLAAGDGRRDEALATMRHAVEIEATNDKEAVTPGEVVPAGEMLGELLESLGRPEEAMEAFVAQLQLSPNRLNGLYGAARSARLTGNHAEAKRYYTQLLALTKDADAGTAGAEEAKKFLTE